MEAKKPGAPVYVCLTWRTYGEFEAALGDCGIKPAACIVWDKGSIGLGYAHYRPQHEFILYAKGEGASWFGGLAQGDIWQTGRGCTEDYMHPTQKPVELVERALNNSSKQGDVVLDCFGGSGSTLIACERLQPKARLMEIDPKYVDVIVRRWQEYAGKKARRAKP